VGKPRSIDARVDPLDRSHNEFAHSPGRDRLLFALIGTASARHPVARKPTLLAEACNDGTADDQAMSAGTLPA